MAKPLGRANRQTAETEAAFMAALRRIMSGNPREERNVALAARGRLHVTIATVAREAGRSRTLIGSENCLYPKIRQCVLKAMEKVSSSERRPSALDLVKNLREDKATLERHIGVLATRLHDASLHVWELEKRCERLEYDLAESIKKIRKLSRPGSLDFGR